MSFKQLSTCLSACVVLALAVVFTAGGVATAASKKCTIKNNIEAIIDDSGSMTFSDSAANRAAAIKLLIAKSGNAKKTLGALEFGSGFPAFGDVPAVPAASTLFAPELIAPNAAAMATALDTNLTGDHGATDYNSAFTLAKTDDPSATARIFITDGGHNEGDYANGHQGGPPTYVLGMGIGKATAFDGDATRLQTIAKETGGVYYPNVDTNNVQATVNKVDAALNCTSVSKTYSNVFTKLGQSKTNKLSVGKKSKSIGFTLTWPSALDKFTISGFKLKPKHGKAHLKFTQTAGATFLNVKVTRLKQGKLTFKLKNTAFGSAAGTSVTLTTQATPGTH